MISQKKYSANRLRKKNFIITPKLKEKIDQGSGLGKKFLPKPNTQPLSYKSNVWTFNQCHASGTQQHGLITMEVVKFSTLQLVKS